MLTETVGIIPAVKIPFVGNFWEGGVPTGFAIEFERMGAYSSFIANILIELLVAYCPIECC